MTPEEINRVIAEKVMDAPNPFPNWMRDADGSYLRLRDGFQAYYEFYDVFDPYHRIDHAIMALEKLRLQGYWCHLFGRPKTWSAALAALNDPTKDDVLQYADTPQAAICLALVEAVKEEP